MHFKNIQINSKIFSNLRNPYVLNIKLAIVRIIQTRIIFFIINNLINLLI